jgi:aminoglycoside phosphotransferase (APT) family kinase protein
VDLIGTGDDADHLPQMVPLPGGHSGETFLAEAAGERSVVRIYAGRGAARGANAAEVDAAVLRLVRGLLPVPEVLEVRRADPSAGTPSLLVTSWLAGTRLDKVLPIADARLAAAIGRNLGRILARLAQMPLLRAGTFLDGELRIGPMPPGADDLVAWIGTRAEGSPLAAWTATDRKALLDLADRAQAVIDLTGRACLVHSDFNPKNLLVDPTTGEVTGLVDWEFAHAGSPFADLGNLLRFDRQPHFAEAAVATYSELVVDAPGNLLDRARAADLFALVDLAARRGENPVADRAHDLLLATARSGDLHTAPGGRPTVR